MQLSIAKNMFFQLGGLFLVSYPAQKNHIVFFTIQIKIIKYTFVKNGENIKRQNIKLFTVIITWLCKDPSS